MKHNWHIYYSRPTALGVGPVKHVRCEKCDTFYTEEKKYEECIDEDDLFDEELTRHVKDNIYYSPKKGYHIK